MLMKFALVVLALCVGVKSQRPSSAEFNLFCRILARANDLMYGPDYVYDENIDRETITEMTVLFNATTSNMNEFRKTLWVTKDFFEAHPPPTQSESRKRAHREIGNLIKEGEEKIEENKKIALEVNKKINEAKLSVAHGLYGEHVKEVPKDDKNLAGILNNTESTFGSNASAKDSCGHNGGKGAGKTLINDLFCVCAGEGDNAEGPCHPKIWPPKSWPSSGCKGGCCKSGTTCCDKNCCNCCNGNSNCKWTLIKFGLGEPTLVPSFNESFQKIEHVCREEMMANDVNSKDTTALLGEYVGMIGMGDKKTNKETKKIFGHSERSAGGGNNEVENCTGEQGKWKDEGPEKHNNNICVDYTNSQSGDGKTYNIPWHKKFREASEKLQDAKKVEERILKNRAALLLLKSQAWLAYSREKDDETSNLDDMNASGGKDTMTEKKTEAREYIDVSEETTQPSQPSQPAPSNKDGRQYTYISSTESTQEEAQAAPAGGGKPKYIYVSSTGTPSQPTPPPETPTQTQQDPPTQSAKRLRDENKARE